MKKDWTALFSSIALIVSFLAILFALYPQKGITSKEVIEICLAVTSMAITVLLGVQIYTVLSIDKRIKEAVDHARSEAKKESLALKKQLSDYTVAIQRYTAGNLYIVNDQYSDAFRAFCHAAIDGYRLQDERLLQASLLQASEILLIKSQVIDDVVRHEDIEQILDGLIHIPDKRASRMFNVLSAGLDSYRSQPNERC